MTTVLRGEAWVFPGQVTTDDILPGRYLDRHGAELGQFAMSGIEPEFASMVKPGDIVVAGENFGAGSGRESAPAALRYAGVGAVVCTGAARVFYRNSVNLGLPVVVVDSIAGIAPGDAVTVDIAEGVVRVPSKGLVLPARNLGGIALDILAAGGIVPYTMSRKNGGSTASNGAATGAAGPSAVPPKAKTAPSSGAAPSSAPPLSNGAIKTPSTAKVALSAGSGTPPRAKAAAAIAGGASAASASAAPPGASTSTVDAKGPFGGRVGWGKRPALLIVDFMRGYTEADQPFYAPPVVDAVRATLPLLAAARAKGVPVVFTKVLYSEHGLEGGHFVRKIPALRKLVEGARCAEIVPELAPRAGEAVLTKQYASSFFGTPLASLLLSLGVDTLIVTGCSTSGCVRATAVDGMQHGLRVIVPRECVGDRTAEPHLANLFDIDAKYGDVEAVADVLKKLEALS